MRSTRGRRCDRPRLQRRSDCRRATNYLGSYAATKLRAFTARTDYFDAEYVERLLARGDQLTWVVLNFVLWHEYWIEGQREFELPATQPAGQPA